MKTTSILKAFIITVLIMSCSNNDDNQNEETQNNSFYPTNRLRAYYSLNGNVNDLHNNYNAEQSNIIYEVDRNESPSKAATFNGEDAMIAFPDAVRFDPTKSSTLAFWIKTNQESRFDLFDQRIGSNSPDNYNHGIIINQGNFNDVYYNYPNYTPLGETSFMINSTICDGDWHHLVFIKDIENAKMKLYIDNQEVFSPDLIEDYDFEINGTLLLGTNYNATSYFEGKIDDIFIYERALENEEINNIFNYNE